MYFDGSGDNRGRPFPVQQDNARVHNEEVYFISSLVGENFNPIQHILGWFRTMGL